MRILSWIIGNKIMLIGAGVLVGLLGLQTYRLSLAKNENEALHLRVEQYQASLALLRETSARRERAIIEDNERSRLRSEELLNKIEKIDEDEDAPVADVITNAIGRL